MHIYKSQRSLRQRNLQRSQDAHYNQTSYTTEVRSRSRQRLELSVLKSLRDRHLPVRCHRCPIRLRQHVRYLMCLLQHVQFRRHRNHSPARLLRSHLGPDGIHKHRGARRALPALHSCDGVVGVRGTNAVLIVFSIFRRQHLTCLIFSRVRAFDQSQLLWGHTVRAISSYVVLLRAKSHLLLCTASPRTV